MLWLGLRQAGRGLGCRMGLTREQHAPRQEVKGDGMPPSMAPGSQPGWLGWGEGQLVSVQFGEWPSGLAGRVTASGRVSPGLNALTWKGLPGQGLSLPSSGACKQKLHKNTWGSSSSHSRGWVGICVFPSPESWLLGCLEPPDPVPPRVQRAGSAVCLDSH